MGNQQSFAGFVPPLVLVDSVTTSSGRTYVNLDTKNWQQGGVTTVMSPSAISAQPLFSELQMEIQPEGTEQGNNTKPMEYNKGRNGGRRSTIVKDEDLGPEEEERRHIRRDRNKLAAARCRKRRVDQTETLQKDVDELEDKKRAMMEEIHCLKSQKDELEFILDAHKTACKQSQHRVAVNTAEFFEPRVVVKAEPPTEVETIRHLTHAEAMDEVQVHSTTSASTSVYGKPQRPASLSLTSLKSNSKRSIEGIPIDTPTNAITSLNFDALMDGRTGLTPTNILTPININLATSMSLNTPSVTTPSCGSQQRNNMYGMAELGSPSTGAPNLVSL